MPRARAGRRAALAAALTAVLAIAGCQGPPSPGRGAPPQRPSPAAPSGTAVSGFLAFGDFGNRGGQPAVAQAMDRWAARHRVDALVTTGDNVYPNGEPAHYRAALDTPYAALRQTRPLWVTLGNHDERDGNGPAQLRYLGLPPLPYAKSLPDVQLLFLDANRVTAAQTRWLDRELTRPGPRFRVVVFHQPAYSCSRHGSTPEVVDRWVPVLERHRVTLVLSGHDHNYQRFVSPRGVTYVVTGGGGARLYDVTPGCTNAVRQQARARTHHFVGVEARPSGLSLTAVARDGRTLDTAVLPAQPTRVSPPG